MNDSLPLLELSGIEVRFGDFCAIDGIDLTLNSGQVHGLLGDNGAGKSTLVKVMAGLLSPSGGEILWRGSRVKLSSPKLARGLGIAWVDQEPAVFDGLTVAQNLALVRTRGDSADWPLLPPSPHRLEPNQRVTSLTMEQKQFLAIEMALAARPQLLILDEPTTSLTPRLGHWLQSVIWTLAAAGRSIVIISHRRTDLSSLIDSATHLSAGQVLHRWRAGEDMALSQAYPPVIVSQSTANESKQKPLVLTFNWHGKDWQFMAATTYGLVFTRAEQAEDFFKTITHLSHKQKRTLGLRSLPSQQSRATVAPALGLVENIQITADDSLSRFGWLRFAAARRLARAIRAEAGLGIPSIEQPASHLSGGNRQKLALLREIVQNPKILVLEQPFNGLDRAASQMIANRLRLAQGRGMTVIVLCFDRDEVTPFCDRIIDV